MHAFQMLLFPLVVYAVNALDYRQTHAQQNRNLEESPGSTDADCFIEALTFGSSTASFSDSALKQTLDKVLQSSSTVCPDLTSCDLMGTSLYSDAKAICDAAGGQLLTTDLLICSEALATITQILGLNTTTAEQGGSQEQGQQTPLPDAQISNAPICLPPEPTCPSDIDILPAIASFLDQIPPNLLTLLGEDGAETVSAILPIVKAILEGDCTSTSAGSSRISALFMAGVTAIFASLVVATL